MRNPKSGRAFRRIMVLGVLVVGLLIPPAVAIPSASAETSRDRFTVDFTIPFGAPCADLPPGVTSVSGTANFFVVTTVRADSSGLLHVNQNQFASGTATDNEGGTYSFSYANHASYTIPPGDFPQRVRMSDHFNLNGKGKAAHMQVGFVIVGTIEGPDDPFPWHTEAISVRGDAFNCDPI